MIAALQTLAPHDVIYFFALMKMSVEGFVKLALFKAPNPSVTSSLFIHYDYGRINICTQQWRWYFWRDKKVLNQLADIVSETLKLPTLQKFQSSNCLFWKSIREQNNRSTIPTIVSGYDTVLAAVLTPISAQSWCDVHVLLMRGVVKNWCVWSRSVLFLRLSVYSSADRCLERSVA